MKKSNILFLFALWASLGFGQAGWKTDAVHSSVNFDVDHMMFSTVNGKFQKFSIDVSGVKSASDFSGASVTASVDVNSINTDNPDRDKHLKSADFFDAANHPSIQFQSTYFKNNGQNEYLIGGNLTIRGVTKPIVFKATLLGGLKDSKGQTHVGWKATASINRTDFGLLWNQVIDAGSVLVGEQVRMTVYAELIGN